MNTSDLVLSTTLEFSNYTGSKEMFQTNLFLMLFSNYTGRKVNVFQKNLFLSLKQ